MRTLYHYTSQSNWLWTEHRNPEKVLRPLRVPSLVRFEEDPSWSKQPCIYAFLEREPVEWINNKEFPEVWGSVMKHVTHGDPILMLLEIKLPANVEAYVLDWAHMERVRPYIHPTKTFDFTKEARQYIASAVPLSKYRGGHSLPEVVIPGPISLENIEATELID